MKLLLIVISLHLLSTVSPLQWCEKDVYETELHTPTEEVDALVLWFPLQAGSHNVLPLCSKNTGLPVERHCSYNRQANNARWDVIDQRTKFLNCSVIVNNCKGDSFEHSYLLRNNKSKIVRNKWQPARAGELANSEKPCLLETGLPLTRRCLYNAKHYAAEWEEKQFEDIKCLGETKQPIVTYDLSKLFQDVKGSDGPNDWESLQSIEKLKSLLTKAKTVRIAADLEISTNILKALTQGDRDVDMVQKVLSVTNLLLESDDNVVRSSNNLDTPSTLIKTVETYLDDMANVLVPTSKCADVPHGVYKLMENLTSVFYINPACSNVSGIAVYNASTKPTASMYEDNTTNTYYRYLYLNQSETELVNEPHLEVAAYFPQTLWESLVRETAGSLNVEVVRMTLYTNRIFFVEQEPGNEKMPDRVVLTISIPGYSGDLPEDLPLILRQHQMEGQEKMQCGYWNYKTWNYTGITTSNAELDRRDLILCKTSHLTPFSYVIGVEFEGLETVNSVISAIMDESTLDVVSIAGCSLSLFGLMCIWVTAMCCKQWRSQSSNKLLLNMCFVLTLIMAYFLFINMPNLRESLVDMRNHLHCVAMGALLQYLILVLFLWMLFIATLQYQRYVTVVGFERPRHFIAKYALAAWGLPLIPTALVIYLDPKSYMPLSIDVKDAICYPSGYSFYFAVMLPICIIVVANFGIFLYIMCSIHLSLKKFKRAQDRKDLIIQVRLSILLFFLLGISWLFGVLANITESVVLSFLFCLTSSLQGFILFIYVVVIDRGTRYSWLKWFSAAAYNKMDETAMTQMTSMN